MTQVAKFSQCPLCLKSVQVVYTLYRRFHSFCTQTLINKLCLKPIETDRNGLSIKLITSQDIGLTI